MTQKTIDQQIDAGLNQVKKQKQIFLETEANSNGSWITTAVLNLPNMKLNLQTAKEPAIVAALAELLSMQDYHLKAAKILDSKSAFIVDGYTIEEWQNDFKLRLNKIKAKNEKEKLDNLEQRLKNIMSEDLKRSKELEAIMNELEE